MYRLLIALCFTVLPGVAQATHLEDPFAYPYGTERADPATETRLAAAARARERKDFDRAAALLEPLAAAGNAEATYRLAWMHYKGEIGPEDPARAARLLARAALAGHLKAQYFIGEFYRYGDGVPEDLDAAECWMTIAAERGYARAQFWLGAILHSDGHVTSGNYWLRRALRQRDAKALYFTGRKFLETDELADDRDWGYAYIAEAARQGDARAINMIADAVRSGNDALRRRYEEGFLLMNATEWSRESPLEGPPKDRIDCARPS